MNNERLIFYFELYKLEIDRRKELNNSIAIPITLLAGLLSGVFFLLSNWPIEKTSNLQDVFFIISICLTLVSISYSAYLVFAFYANITKGYKTEELPLIEDIENYYQQLSKKYSKQEKLAESKFMDFQIQKIVESTNSYQKANDQKVERYFKFKKNILLNLVFLVVSGLYYLFIKYYLAVS